MDKDKKEKQKYIRCGQCRYVDRDTGREFYCKNEAMYYCGGFKDWPVCDECLVALQNEGIEEARMPSQILRPEQEAAIARMRALTKKAFGDELSVSFFRTKRDREGEPGPHLYIGFSSHDRIVMHGHDDILEAAEVALLILAKEVK